jgi:hypothetical protein
MIADIVQALMLVTGAVAIVLASRPAPVSRWGWLIGLASQPLWLYTTFAAGQWGMCALSVVYTFGWGNGVWREWRGRA